MRERERDVKENLKEGLDIAISLSPVRSEKPSASCFHVVAISLMPYARIILPLSALQHILASKSHPFNAHVKFQKNRIH